MGETGCLQNISPVMSPKGRKAMAKAPASKPTKNDGLKMKDVKELGGEPLTLEQKMQKCVSSAKKECGARLQCEPRPVTTVVEEV